MKLEIRAARPGGSKLVNDYLAREPRALAFYAGSYCDPEAFRDKAHTVGERFDAESRAAAAQAIHAPEGPAAERLRRVVEEDGFFVTTGQQPGLFGGPLYCLYKGLSAALLANRLEELLHRPVAPLFWVASEDHDWPEVNHTWIVDMENELQRVALPDSLGAHGPPLFRVPLGDEISGVVETFNAALPDSDFATPFKELVRTAYAPGATMGGAFRQVMEAVLGPYGVSFVDAADPALKSMSRGVLTRAVVENQAQEAVLLRVAGELEEAGYHVQVPVLEGGLNLFLEAPDGARERVYRDGDGFVLRHSQVHLTREELLDRIQNDPSTVSPNVFLRPVVESTVFPTVAYVAGPGEMAYYAELREYFEAFDLRMPVIFPRHGAWVVESKIRKVLEKFDLDLGSMDQPFHELAGEIARNEEPEDIKRILGELRGAVGKGSGELLQASREIDPTLKGPISHMRSGAFQLLSEVEKKILHSIKRENEIALAQVEKAQHHLYPNGKPQERVLNMFYYLTRYGNEFVPAVADQFSIEL